MGTQLTKITTVPCSNTCTTLLFPTSLLSFFLFLYSFVFWFRFLLLFPHFYAYFPSPSITISILLQPQPGISWTHTHTKTMVPIFLPLYYFFLLLSSLLALFNFGPLCYCSFPFANVPHLLNWTQLFLNTHTYGHTSLHIHTFKHRNRHKTQAGHTHTHTNTKSTHRAHTVPIHLTKPLSSWKRLIWAPAAPNHPIRDRAISSPLGLSEPFVQVPLFLRRWQDGVVFRASCHSFWARSEGLSLARTLQFIYIVLCGAPDCCEKCTLPVSKQDHISPILL